MIDFDFFNVAFDNFPKFKISFVKCFAVFLSNLERVKFLFQIGLHCKVYTVNVGQLLTHLIIDFIGGDRICQINHQYLTLKSTLLTNVFQTLSNSYIISWV